ncbi:glycine oxidase ThiO [Thermoactinomyces vulgaris]|uniref:glycine oxidase ThiO n=1 Tax=Thermoactinomyces vulgaris TaxID=2026 RepID=UPI0011076559|nr:glycine oxidase ThiO [Thermoactinomyces vulgaris]QCV55088.1 glycine oxidase ThiO [Thermoactinomyces vulgaris]
MKHSDVLIIGGGIIGSSIAYHLAKAKVKVVILEQDRAGAHASRAAAGMLGAQVEMHHPGPLADACLKSRSMFPELAEALREQTGLDIELNRSGLIKPARSEEEAAGLKERMKWQKAIWLDRKECLEKERGLGEEVIGGLFFSEEFQVSAPRLTQALIRAAQQQGAKLIEDCKVIDFCVENGRIRKVVTPHEEWAADTVVLAAGAWTGIASRRLGLNLPVYPVKGESFALKTTRPSLKHTIFGNDVYIVPKANGEWIIGATEKEHQWDPGVTAEAVYRLIADASRYLPGVKELNISRMWASVRPGTPDKLPVIGRLENIDHCIVATGHFRNGILLSPWTGQVVARLILGETEEECLPFSPRRFTG